MTQVIPFYLDLETYSEVNLQVVGAWNYTRHPSTFVTLFAGAFGGKIPFLLEDDIPSVILDRLNDPAYMKISWNIGFDREVLEQVFGLHSPVEQWTDAMMLAYTLALPPSLEKCGLAVGLDEDERKLADGKRLIQLFAKPNRQGKRNDKISHPEDWAKWRAYGIQDVETMRTLCKWMRPYLRFTHTPAEREAFITDQYINMSGVPIDMEHCRNVTELYENYKAIRVEHSRAITGLDNPTSVPQLKRWLAEQGIHLPNMQKGTVKGAIDEGIVTGDIAEACRVRLEVGKSSVAKFQQLYDKTDPHTGLLHYTLQFYGAHTGRWAGRGAQLHNLPQGCVKGETVEAIAAEFDDILFPLISAGDHEMIAMMYENVGEALASTLRPTITAPPGYEFLVVDYSSVETAVIAWLSGCSRLLDLMHGGGDPYKDFATEMFGIHYDSVTKSQRNFCKPAVLGAVFGLGWKGYQNYASGFGQVVDEAVAEDTINTFRHTYHEVKSFWYTLKRGYEAVINGTTSLVVGDKVQWHKLDNNFLFSKLPSGRSLAYPYPQLNEVPAPWDENKTVNEFSYMIEHRESRQWIRHGTHPGKVAENQTQAVARDLLAEGLSNARAHGFNTVLHVHDEVIALVPKNHSELNLQSLTAVLTQHPKWASGMPLKADGYTCQRYIKD
jgi:DNA polymerase